MLGPSLLIALGLGLAFVPITILAETGVHDREYGLASGLVNASQQIGGALGLAVLTTIATTRTNHLIATQHPINQIPGLYQQRRQEPVRLSQVTDPVRQHDQRPVPHHLVSDTTTLNLHVQHVIGSLVGDETSPGPRRYWRLTL